MVGPSTGCPVVIRRLQVAVAVAVAGAGVGVGVGAGAVAVVVVVVLLLLLLSNSSSSSKARPQAPGSFLLLEWFCWFFRVIPGEPLAAELSVVLEINCFGEKCLK